MASLTPVIETLENRWMRAWVQRDLKAMRALTSRDFMLVTGSKPPMILDSRSWLDAAGSRYLCTSFRFGDIYVRNLGGMALFASQLDLKATLDDQDWSGRYWITDLWRKGKVRRSWKLVQRVVSHVDDTPDIPAGIRALQLWHPRSR